MDKSTQPGRNDVQITQWNDFQELLRDCVEKLRVLSDMRGGSQFSTLPLIGGALAAIQREMRSGYSQSRLRVVASMIFDLQGPIAVLDGEFAAFAASSMLEPIKKFDPAALQILQML